MGEKKDHETQYELLPSPDKALEEDFQKLSKEDKHLKRRIRTLRFFARLLTFLLAICVLVPISMTVYKFMTTKNTLRDVLQPDGSTLRRSAWALNSTTWPTWMYFGIAVSGVLLNAIVLLSYLRSVRGANIVATVEATFSTVVLVAQVVVWIVTVTLYRSEKKTEDLWGWTCSAVARTLQEEFSDVVKFNKWCQVQSLAWYFGLAQTAVIILSAVTLWLAVRRMKMQKRSKRVSTALGKMSEAYEPTR